MSNDKGRRIPDWIRRAEDTGKALQHARDQALIENAREALADAEKTSLGEMNRMDIAERAIRLEVALKNMLDIIARTET